MSRTLISDDGRVRRYRVTDAQGQQVGEDAEPIPTPAEANADTLRTRAQAALDANTTFLALSTPTAAQNAAQVQRLTRECSALIRLLLNLTDSTDGT